ncbi:hypothetical protein SLS53_005185 [Cytospora paraplurivora]|uniref:DUF8035 domain-containing protein n=1 Tax=Cytospora paraplurivora TaxID=2898453 RepID=A0AAN9U7W9_9PEZI
MPETYRRYEERDTIYDDEPRGPPSRRPASSRGGDDFFEPRRERSPPPGAAGRRSDVQVHIREDDRESRVPHFLRDDGRRPEAGPLVLRQRDVETVERARPRPRSPSPSLKERFAPRMRPRSLSPPPPDVREREEIRTRVTDRSRERIRSPSRGPALDRVRLGTRIIERPERSPSPPPVLDRLRTRISERERSPSPKPLPPPDMERSRSRIRVIDREQEREPTPSPSPPPPAEPPVIRGPTIEREVITHYRDIDHGMVLARPPSPPPPPRRAPEQRETDIDIYTGRDGTEVDITRTRSRSRPRARSVSRERPRQVPSYDQLPTRDRSYIHDDEIIINSARDKLKIDIDHERRSSSARPRSRSAAPGFDDEAEYITGKIDSRGRNGEAWGGATKDWTVVDVPPGTEKVRLDGAGGGTAEVTWQKYSGARKTKFVPERASDGALVPLSPPASSSTVISDREGYAPPRGDRERDRLSVQIYDKDREIDVEKVTDRRISLRPSLPSTPAPKSRDMWTEVTKDLVVREAIEEAGYDYEETELFFYIMQYLRYEDVLELVEISDRIRARRKDRIREIQYEREIRDDWDRERRHRPRPRWEDDRERVVEREVVFDTSRPRRY